MNYPEEYYLEIDGDNKLRGQILINQNTKDKIKYYYSEINIVSMESSKIWCHVTILYDYLDKDDLLNQATQELIKYLRDR